MIEKTEKDSQIKKRDSMIITVEQVFGPLPLEINNK